MGVLSVAILALVLGAGCTAPLRGPALGTLYDRAAKWNGVERNPVIVIPGILGSKLVQRDTGRIAWGAFSGNYANPEKPDGLRLLALPMREGATLDELADDVAPNGVLDRTRIDLLGLPVELLAYAKILATLGAGGYRDELLGKAGAVDYGSLHYTCFQFDYDWRRDNIENARRLGAFIREKGEYVRQQRIREGLPNADRPVKFDIVAHSMGGLVARYYLMYGEAGTEGRGDGGTKGDRDQGIEGPGERGTEGNELDPPGVTWAGAEQVERAILIGTPNAGSLNALLNLVDGAEFAPILPKYPPALLGTMPSVYQLLPRGRHGAVRDANGAAVADLLDPAVWEANEWGLASPRADKDLANLLPDVNDAAARRQIAREHLHKCLARARAFHAALDVPAEPPPGLALYLFAGDAVATNAVATVGAGGRLRVSERAPGDGTVLRSSAVLDERCGGSWSPRLVSPIAWRQVNFLFTDHLGLTSDPGFSDNVLFLLLETPRIGRVVN